MRYLSVCSGIEAVSCAWEPLCFEAAGFGEIEPFPCSVLKHHYPNVPNFGDMTQFKEWPIEPGSVDILVGGTPCQSFSVAGLRGGLDDERGNLALTYCRILQKFKPRWFLWENVPGVFSSWTGTNPPSDLEQGEEWEDTETSDFGRILEAFSELGYGWAWSVRDAQYFGVPQRRRRVFVVGYLGDWRRASEALFESGCVSGNPKTRGKKRKDVAGTLASRTSAGGGLGTDFDLDGGIRVVGALACNTGPNGHDAGNFACNQAVDSGHVIAYQCQGSNVGPMGTFRSGNGNETGGVPFVTAALTSRPYSDNAAEESKLISCTLPASTGGVSSGMHPIVATSTGDKSHCLNAGGMGRQDYETETMIAVAFTQNGRDEVRELKVAGALPASPATRQQTYINQSVVAFGNVSDGSSVRSADSIVPPITCRHGDQCSIAGPKHGVRRLTVEECERLQGFPSGYTNVIHRGKPAADGPRYKAIGNSMAVPVISWLGKRILMVDQKNSEPKSAK